MQAANVNIGMNLESAGFVSGAEQARRSFVSNMAGIRRESDKTAAALTRLPTSLKGLDSANDNLKKFGNVAQQAGYQVGDFFVQISSGTSALTAFIQQGSQIAGAFGPGGAIIGALGAAVGALATAFIKAGGEAEEMGRKVDGAAEAIRRLTKAQNDSATAAQARKQLQEQVPTFTGGQLQSPTLEEQEKLASGAIGREQLVTEARLKASNFASAVAIKRQAEIEREIELEKELEEQLQDSLAVNTRDREQAAAAAKTANDKRIADAERVQKELIQLEKERFDYDAENIRNEVELFEKGQQEKQEAFRKLVENAASAINKRDTASGRAAEAESQRLSEIYSQPFKDLATNISNTLSDGIQDALSGDFDFATFAEGFSDIFANTVAASITSVISPALNTAATEFGNAIKAAFQGGGAPGAPGAGVGAGGIPGMGFGSTALGGAAFGGTAGAVYGQYGPGMKPGNQAALGGAIGGAAGAVAGSFLIPIPVVGTLVGAAVGTAIGSFAGGLIGGQNNLGNDRSAQQYRAARGLTYSDVSFSPENRQVTQGILDQVTALQEALEKAGGAIADFGLRIEAGNKTGITVNGKKYPDAQAAMAASLERLIGSTTGLTASQQTVLQTTKAKDAPGIVEDLNFATLFDQLTFKGTELERQLAALAAEMAAFGKRAQELGLDINAVAAAHEKEAQALRDAQTAEQNAIRAAIEDLAPSGNTLDIVLAQLNDQVQELAKAATAAGLPLDDLAAAHQRAAAQIIAANVQLQQSLALQVSALDPATDQLGLALAQLNQQVQELAAQITASGGSLDALAGAHQRAADDIVNQFRERQRLEQQQAEDEQRRLQQQIQAQQEQARAEAAARQAQIADFQARVALLEADPLSAIVIGIQENIRQIIAQGKALGLTARSEAEIRAAGQRLETAARKEFTDALNEQIRNYQTQVLLLEADPLSAALAQIRERFRELIDQGKKIGLTPASEADLRAAQGRAEAAARNRAKLDQDAFALQLRGMGAASNDAGLQMAELELNFKELTLRATELLVPLNLVTEAHARAIQGLQDALALQKADIRNQLAAAGGGTAGVLADQLRDLAIQMQQLARAAAGVGIPLSEVTNAHAKAAQRIRDEWAEMLADMLRQQRDATQGILDAQRGAASAIDQFLNPFKEALSSRGIGQGVYSGASLTQSGLAEFRKTLAQARTGDTQALSSLVGIGQGAISQARQTYGSTKAFADIFREIEAGFREQQGVLETKRDELLSKIGTFTRETVDELIRLRTQAIADLRADFAKLSRDLIVAVEGNA